MVLENLYRPGFLAKRPVFALFMGVTYSLMGIIGALIMFPSDPALIAVAITALLLLPEFNRLTLIEEKMEIMDKHFLHFLKSQRNFYLIYLFMFAGVFLTFAVLALFLPSLATNYLFKTQVNILYGHAAFDTWLFSDLFLNNIIVLGLCFVMALVTGAGALFLIAWNASVWGTIFGMTAQSAALTAGKNPVILIVLIIISVLPHMILEVSSYIGAVMSGSLLSEGIVNNKAKKYWKRILVFNLLLLLIAIAVLAIGMLVETYVLGNFETYTQIISLAFT